MKYASDEIPDTLVYDIRPEGIEYNDSQQADTRPEESLWTQTTEEFVLKPWILPTGNAFIKDASNHYILPEGNPGSDFPFVQTEFDDSSWEKVRLPHDWAIKGPFFEGEDAEVTGGMGRLPSPGVAWYRNRFELDQEDMGKVIYLDIDGAMSYSMVWLNGHLVGGWPFGYTSYRLNLTPYLNQEGPQQLAIRLDNPPESSRWYPGGGLYRNVWLTKVSAVHVDQWGSFVHTPEVDAEQAQVKVGIRVKNERSEAVTPEVVTRIYELDAQGIRGQELRATIEHPKLTITPGSSAETVGETSLKNPKLWGPKPTQIPQMYIAITDVTIDGLLSDRYETSFGVRTIEVDPRRGVLVNGELIPLKGANQHHDLGALGAAFNVRAAQRQLEILREAGVNAIRTAHNPPAKELLDLTDRMGFLVLDESFDVWVRRKTPMDFHLIFPEWHEQDLRALVRRDKNHPSVFAWSTGNEVGEQYTGEAGLEWARYLKEIVHSEDSTRLTTYSMNFAKPPMRFPEEAEIISLNYQGEGIRNAPAYAHLKGINTTPLYPSFKEAHPNQLIVSSENAAAVSSRGTYLFPVSNGISSPISPGVGGDPSSAYVSAYELYTADFGSSADKVFRSLDQHPYVGGGFVWSGWDYLGEPTPYYSARSSYFGFVDLAGFKKDRFYLYQAYWRPDYPMVHMFPHWNWPGREGLVTPIHVATTGDEAELFINGVSQGRKVKEAYTYRLRWDDVTYTPGTIQVVAYKDGAVWTEQTIETTGAPVAIDLEADRSTIASDGYDLSFITVRLKDEQGREVPDANIELSFTIEGPGEIVATDNGDPTDFTPFPLHSRKSFNGLALVIVRSKVGETGSITLKANSKGLTQATLQIRSSE